METLRDDLRDLRACGEERQISETTNSTPQHAFKNSIDSSIPSMQPSIGKMKKPFLINYLFIHNAFEANI